MATGVFEPLSLPADLSKSLMRILDYCCGDLALYVLVYTHVVQSQTEEEQRMSEVLEGLLQKRTSLAAELGALDAGIAAYRRALAPTKSATVKVNSTRPTMSLAARKKLSVLAKARWAKKRKDAAKK